MSILLLLPLYLRWHYLHYLIDIYYAIIDWYLRWLLMPLLIWYALMLIFSMLPFLMILILYYWCHYIDYFHFHYFRLYIIIIIMIIFAAMSWAVNNIFAFFFIISPWYCRAFAFRHFLYLFDADFHFTNQCLPGLVVACWLMPPLLWLILLMIISLLLFFFRWHYYCWFLPCWYYAMMIIYYAPWWCWWFYWYYWWMMILMMWCCWFSLMPPLLSATLMIFAIYCAAFDIFIDYFLRYLFISFLSLRRAYLFSLWLIIFAIRHWWRCRHFFFDYFWWWWVSAIFDAMPLIFADDAAYFRLLLLPSHDDADTPPLIFDYFHYLCLFSII